MIIIILNYVILDGVHQKLIVKGIFYYYYYYILQIILKIY